MAVKMPEGRKFLFIFRMRDGFLAWGFSKIIVSALMVVLCMRPMFDAIWNLVTFRDPRYIPETITFCFLPGSFVVDTFLHWIFVIGIVEQSVMFLRLYYVYSKVLLVVTPTLVFIYLFLVIHEFLKYIIRPDAQLRRLLFTCIIIMFLSLIIQSYVMLLLKHEIIKIKYTKLVNEAIKDGINVTIEQGVTEKEKKTTAENN